MAKKNQTCLTIGLSRAFGPVFIAEHQIEKSEGKKGFQLGQGRLYMMDNKVRKFSMPPIYCNADAATDHNGEAIIIKVADKDQALIGKVIPVQNIELVVDMSIGRLSNDCAITDIDSVMVIKIADQKMLGSARVEETLDAIQVEDADAQSDYHQKIASYGSAGAAVEGIERMFQMALANLEQFRNQVAAKGYTSDNEVTLYWDKEVGTLRLITQGETAQSNENQILEGIRCAISRNRADYVKRADLLKKQAQLQTDLAKVQEELGQ